MSKSINRTACYVDCDMPDNAFAHLTVKDRALLVKLMARLCERSFRRGYHQGAYVIGERSYVGKISLHDWRYGESTDVSRWYDRPGQTEDSTNRLFTENEGLTRLGFANPNL